MGLTALDSRRLAQPQMGVGIKQRAGLWTVGALFAVAGVLAIPLWIAPMPAMPDYPAHLASFYLLTGGAKSPLLAQFYRVHWTFVPNLAGEILVPALASWLGLGTATAIFLCVGLVAWVLGAGAIHWALYRRMGIAPLFAGFFSYNANFMWGFFNYCFATGLALVAFAGWIRFARGTSLWRLAAFALALLAIYFCHVFAAALLLLLIGCHEIGERPLPWFHRLRRAALVASIAVPAVFAFVLLRPGGGNESIKFNLLDTVLDRVGAPVQSAFDQPAWLLLAALTVFWLYGVWTGKIRVHPRMKLALTVLFLAAIFAPEWALGGWGVDLRLPAVVGALAFAAAEFRFENRTQAALAAVALLVAGWNAATLSGNWLYYDRRFAEFRSAARAIEPGSKIVTVLDGDSIGLASDQPYWHMAEYAVIDRQAFTPLLFTTPGQHVIRLQTAVAAIAASSAQQGSPPDISELDDLAAGNAQDDKDIREVFPYLIRFQCHYDVAVVVHLNGHRSKVPDMLRLEHAGSFFSLFRIVPDEACGAR